MSGELDHWKTVDNRERLPQPKTPFYEHAQKLNDLFDTYGKVLDTGKQDGTKCEIIPEFTINTFDRNAGSYRPTKAYFFRPKPSRKNPNPAILAFFDQDISDASTFNKLSIETSDGVIEDLENPGVSFDDMQLFDALVYAADDSLRKRAEARKSRIHSRLGWSATLVCLAALGTGGTALIHNYQTEQVAKKKRAQEARDRFDQSGFTIDGISFTVGNSSTVKVSQAAFKQIPGYRNGDSLEDARRLKIPEDDCKKIDTTVNRGDRITIAVRNGDRFQDEPLGIGTDTKNRLYVCSLRSFAADKDDQEQNDLEIAVQRRVSP
jgi:hypothetical protein